MKKDNDFDYEISDYDSEADAYEIKFNFTEEEYEEIKKNYEEYLETKENIEEAVSLDEFFEIAFHIGLYSKQLDLKREYLDLLKIEIKNLERKIEDYQLKL